MSKYKIAWLPGDGVGNDVMEAAKIVLDKIQLDAEYIHGDIGWEFWKKEANPLPDRTAKLLNETDCALFGAITSMPKEECEAELIPELQGNCFRAFLLFRSSSNVLLPNKQSGKSQLNRDSIQKTPIQFAAGSRDFHPLSTHHPLLTY